MNSPGTQSSPSFRNVKMRQKQSPVEIKEKLRKSYKEKILNSRSLIFNSLRGNLVENELHKTLNDIYKEMFNYTKDNSFEEEEEKILDEIRNDLIKEELNWWLEEYDRCQDNIDWSAVELNANNVICPICQKANLLCNTEGTITCSICDSKIKTHKSLLEIQRNILECIEQHQNSGCKSDVQFTCLTDSDEAHIYLICDTCSDMQIIV